jgi:glycosyltransferase involved in cell wall biosynthesis
MKVCMFTFTVCDEHYISVRKPARTLAKDGYDVRIIAILPKNTLLIETGKDMPSYEESDGLRILRVSLDPVYFKVLRLPGLPRRVIKGFARRRQNKQAAGAFTTSIAGTERLVGSTSIPAATRHPSLTGHRFLKSVHRRIYRLYIGMTVRWIWSVPARYCRYLDYYCRSYSLARRESADVYHANDLITLPVAWMCSRVAGGRLVYHSHELWLDGGVGAPRSRLNRLMVKTIESFLIRRTDANIIAGLSGSKELSRRYLIPAPTVLLNAPEWRPFEYSTVFRDELEIPKEQRIMLYMGVIGPHRGIEQGIRSLRYLSNCCLVIFGFGFESYVAGLKELIQSEGLGERVYFFPAVPFDEVPKYAMSADIGLVLHQNVNLNYYYVSPNKLFESMVAGLPVVGSDFPDLKAFIEGYRFGVTCDPASPNEIAKAVDHILSDRSGYEEMRQNALEAAKIFNWENESKKLLALYEGLGPPATNRLG